MILIGVCGGRDFGAGLGLDHFKAVDTVDRVLSEHVSIADAVVHGCASGADTLADDWARGNRRWVVRVPCLYWNDFGKAAGPMRNAVIAALPLSKLIAFPGGRGTADMVDKARKAGIPVVEIARET